MFVAHLPMFVSPLRQDPRPGTLSIVLIVIGMLSLGVGYDAAAQLSEQDRAALTQALKTLSNGWNGDVASDANGYLGRSDVSVDDWLDYFQDFFATHPLTEDLGTYIAYPTFHWFGDATKSKLQVATSAALQDQLERLVDAGGGYEGSLLQNDSTRENVLNIHYHMHRLVNLSVSEEAEERAYAFYNDHIESHAASLRKTHTIDTDEHPHLGAIRAQIYMNVRDAVWNVPSRKDEVGTLIGLRDPELERYEEVWNAHTVLVIDNNQGDQRQLEVIDDFLRLIPADLHDLGTIRMRDFLGAGAQSFSFKQNHGVNIFTTRVGTRSENGFPHDIDPLAVDLYTTVVAHEINHVVDAYYIGLDEERNRRRDRLIEDAGSYRYHYLRSHVGDGFFQNAPQEFIASISNQYFASSWHTFDLAISRFQRGYRHPLNQFLFFADVYSTGMDSTYFYAFDKQGNLSREAIPLYRDEQDRITEMKIDDGEVYRFTLDTEGNVTAIEVAETMTSMQHDELPAGLRLRQNYPNPFNPSTTITYTLARPASVQLEVIDTLGRRVALLVERNAHPSGTHQVVFEADELSSGVYFYRLHTDAHSIARKMQLVK